MNSTTRDFRILALWSGKLGQMSEVATAAGPGASVYDSYPLMHATAVHDGMRRDMPNKRVFILTRSAYAGQQRNAAVTWSGDVTGTWARGPARSHGPSTSPLKAA
jgi:alpha-glucosidase (family GH31 glycosyl hydrolase)